MQVRLIDANALGYAHHCAQPVREAGDLQVQSVAGVLHFVASRILYEPKVLNVLVWDDRAQWRFDLLPTYKSGRGRTPEQREMRRRYAQAQPWLQKALSFLPVVQATCAGAEADDLAWGLSRRLAEAGHLVTLLTSDQGWLQMVRPRVRWCDARRFSRIIEHEGFAKACDYAAPAFVPQVKALTGDASDDIEGVPDIGPKHAAALLARYGSLEGVLQAASDDFAFSQEARHYHALMLPQWREKVLVNRRLVDLSQGPALAGEQVSLVVGETLEELELYELMSQLGLEDVVEDAAWWHRLYDCEPARADLLSVRRAVSSLEQAWTPG